jgi:hypothetical protein
VHDWQFWLLLLSLWSTAQRINFDIRIGKRGIGLFLPSMTLFCLVKLIGALL